MIIKTENERRILAENGHLLANILCDIKKYAGADLSLQDIENYAQNVLTKKGLKSAFLNYHGFPSIICLSVNDNVVHGLANDTILREGDFLKVDLGLKRGGLIVDAAISFGIGKTSKEVKQLERAGLSALKAAVGCISSGVRTGDIGCIIEETLKKYGAYPLKELTGHGTGRKLHESPNIPCFGIPGKGEKLTSNMVVAVEVMASQKPTTIRVGKDNFTIGTADGSMGVHFEHTLIVTDEGAQIITPWEECIKTV